MAKNELIQPQFGKKKMVRGYIPVLKKEETGAKKADIDPDLLKYWGREVDLSLIPDHTGDTPVLKED